MGFTCACHYVAKIASLRFPREKNRPRTPQSARVDDGISAPVQKIPPRSTSEPSPPPPNDTSLPIDPPNALSTWCKPEGAREDTKKSSNRLDVKILSDRPIKPNQSTSPSPLLCAHPQETATQRIIDVSHGSAGGGQEDRLYMYYFLFIHLNFLLHLTSPPPHSIVNLLSPSQTVPRQLL